MKKREKPLPQTGGVQDQQKQKKLAKRAGIILIILIAIIVVLVVAIMNSEDSQPSEAAPEGTKASADANDMEIARSVWSAKQYVTRFEEEIQDMGTGENSLGDVYEYAGDAEEFLLELSSRVDAIEMNGDIAAAYKDNASGYIATVGVISMDIQDFIDTNDQSKLSSIKQNLSLLPEAENMVNESRTAYLKDAGFTDEEIAARPQIGNLE